MSKARKNPHRGSRLENFLADEGLLEEVNASAKKRVTAQRRNQGMRSFEAWKRKQLKAPAVKAEYDALEAEFALARKRIAARVKRKR